MPGIVCLFVGHKPHPTFEFVRLPGNHRQTYCTRCGQSFTHIVSASYPVPDGWMTTERHEDRFIAKLTDVLTDSVEMTFNEAVDVLLKSRRTRARSAAKDSTAQPTPSAVDP